ncbi:MAG: phosphotransferase family protein [Acidimicrobiia bacterium]
MADDQLTTSTRDRELLVGRFTEWFRATTGDRTAIVRDVGSPSASGFSSDTLLLDLAWTADGGLHERAVVVRLPPPADAWPVFPDYDLGRQVAAMRAVCDGSTSLGPVPVPEVLWFVADPAVLGAEFMVMERINGEAAPDVMPYTWGSWVTELSAADQQRLADASIDLLAGIHAVDVTPEVADAITYHQYAGTPLQRHFAHELAYYEWAREGRHFPTIERGFAVLQAHCPTSAPEARIGWGDARIGNILFVDATPTAVLDWEMVALTPPAVDLAWMVYFAEHLQRSALRRDLPGIPGLLAPDTALARYEHTSGTTVDDFAWHLCYAGVREMVISIRTMGRAVHFGQMPAPAEPEGLLLGLDYVDELIDALDRS